MKNRTLGYALIIGGVGVAVGASLLLATLMGSEVVWQNLGAIVGGIICTVSIVVPIILLVTTLAQGKKRKEISTPTNSLMSTPPSRPTDSRKADLRVVDLRPADAQRREQRAQRILDDEDERIAQKLAFISLHIEANSLEYGSDLYKELANQIKEIGEYLCTNGGAERMDLICYRVNFLHGNSRYVRRNWAGICGWEY